MDYQDFFRERYEREDPWHFGSCPFEKIRHDAMIEFALSLRPRLFSISAAAKAISSSGF